MDRKREKGVHKGETNAPYRSCRTATFISECFVCCLLFSVVLSLSDDSPFVSSRLFCCSVVWARNSRGHGDRPVSATDFEPIGALIQESFRNRSQLECRIVGIVQG